MVFIDAFMGAEKVGVFSFMVRIILKITSPVKTQNLLKPRPDSPSKCLKMKNNKVKKDVY